MKDISKSTDVVRYPAVVKALAMKLNLPPPTVKSVIEGLVAIVASELRNDKRVNIGGLGLLFLRNVQADPTGAKEGDPAKRAVLAASKKFKTAVGI